VEDQVGAGGHWTAALPINGLLENVAKWKFSFGSGTRERKHDPSLFLGRRASAKSLLLPSGEWGGVDANQRVKLGKTPLEGRSKKGDSAQFDDQKKKKMVAKGSRQDLSSSGRGKGGGREERGEARGTEKKRWTGGFASGSFSDPKKDGKTLEREQKQEGSKCGALGVLSSGGAGHANGRMGGREKEKKGEGPVKEALVLTRGGFTGWYERSRGGT